MAFAELHFHLLPGLDDGPATLPDSLALARAAAAEGTRTIVTTPHVNPDYADELPSLPARVRVLAAELRRAGIPIELLRGGELAPEMVDRLSDRELETIAQGPSGRRWLLLEASLTGLDGTYTAAADELRRRGFAVVVAHPERALANFQAGWPVLEHEMAAGSAMQVNAWSVAGVYGERMRIDALRVLQASLQVAIASDAHGAERMPSLNLALRELTSLGVHEPRRFFDAVPNRLLSEGLAARPQPAPVPGARY